MVNVVVVVVPRMHSHHTSCVRAGRSSAEALGGQKT